MIQLVIAFLVLGIVIAAILWIPARPSVAIALLIGMYGSEQVLAAAFPLLVANGSLFNFVIGGVGMLAIIVSVLRSGFPRPPVELLIAFGLLFFLTCTSLIWSSGPILGTEWVTHFVAEIPLAILLPIATLRRFDDFKPVVQVSALLATLVALSTIISPIISSYSGRTYLTEGGTVLSPAEFTGLAFVLVATIDKRFLGFLAGVRIPIAGALAAGTLLSGARGQFLLAVGLVALIFLARRYSTRLTGLVATIILLLVAVPIAFVVIFSDLGLPSFRASKRFTQESVTAGFEIRLGLISESLTLERPIVGHGVGAWSFMHNRVDATTTQLDSMTLHPHNSLAQVYFELGIIGLLLFGWILSIGVRNIRLLFSIHRTNAPLRSVVAAFTAYFVYAVLLSMKQSTFLAAMGIYISIASLTALIETSRAQETEESTHLREQSGDIL